MAARRLLFLLVLLALPGCAGAPPPAKFADLTYSHLGQIRLDVVQVTADSAFEPSFQPPQVEHLFPVPPERAALNWARDRLAAAAPGGERYARFIVRRAGVVEEPLSPTGGITGLLRTDQEARYTAVMEASLEIRGPRNMLMGEVTANVQRSRTVPEGQTLNEREGAWFELTSALMTDFDAQMTALIRQHLGRFLAP